MIRIAHFSDLHYGPKNLIEADRCFGAGIDQAIALGLQAAVLSGDSTDHALDLHSPAAERLVTQVRRLADHCPVLMLQGTFSHEPPGTLSIFKLLGGRYPVHVADRIGQVGLMPQGRWQASSGWAFDGLPDGMLALFSCIPTVNKAVVAVTVGASAAAEALGEQVAALLAGFAPSHRQAKARGVPSIGVSHGTVFGCLSEHGVPMAGFDHEFTTGALFGAEAQAFLLGHIHRHQVWDGESRAGRQCIAYAGSIGRFHHGEDGEKGFLLWEVDAASAVSTLHPTPARRTVDIVFEGKPDLDVLRAAIVEQNIAGAHVRVRWTVADEDRHGVNREAIQLALSATPT
jgi:exonuclease SbcD